MFIVKKILTLAKGAISSNSNLYRIAQQHVIKTFVYSYRSRHKRKCKYQTLWVTRLNARVRIYDWNYSSFIYKLCKKNCLINRKILVILSLYDPIAFQVLFIYFNTNLRRPIFSFPLLSNFYKIFYLKWFDSKKSSS